MEAIQKVYEFLEKAGTFYLATVEEDQPRVRPYGAMLFFEGKIYIMAFGKTNATRQIAVNNKAEICAFKGQTLRIECKLVEDNRPEVGKALVDKMPVSVLYVVQDLIGAKKQPPRTYDEEIAGLRRCGMKCFAAWLDC